MIKCRLEELLKTKNTTIQSIHENTKINRDTIAKLSKNQLVRIDLKTIEELCKTLDCSMGELFIMEE